MNLAEGRVLPGRGLSLALVACCVLAVAGCGSAGAGDDLGAEVVTQEATAATAAPVLPSEAEALARWRAWEPTTKVVAREYSEDEAARMRLEWLEANRPDAAAGLPVPELVAWSEVDNEPVAACMREAGFNTVQYDPSGSLVTDDVSGAQGQREEVVWWECSARYTIPPARMEIGREDSERVLYEYYRDFYLDCVAGLGVELPRSDVPSQEEWLAKTADGRTDVWDPTTWSHAPGSAMPQALTRDLADRLCPPLPPPVALYGA